MGEVRDLQTGRLLRSAEDTDQVFVDEVRRIKDRGVIVEIVHGPVLSDKAAAFADRLRDELGVTVRPEVDVKPDVFLIVEAEETMR